jgi:hypothetical protein
MPTARSWTGDLRGHGRFADGTTHATYKFALPPDVTGGTLTLHIGNQFLVEVSPDNATWRKVAEETGDVRDLANLADRSFDLNDLRGGASTLYVRIGDSRPDTGWGGWLGHVKLVMARG